ncbi:hypothetical protein FOL47_000579 [Perkinsus chesapeaki]|uniref:Uncharacterized protein n=1 Tax=Perkinsus chesapeaki TaxID=330153 RepID=A0A7J6MLD1_PERCH|nr:hypothetical protein FOL47_000579 [Perkinsus chesapeaki]
MPTVSKTHKPPTKPSSGGGGKAKKAGENTAPTTAANSPTKEKSAEGDVKKDSQAVSGTTASSSVAGKSSSGENYRYCGKVQWYWVKRGRGMVSSNEVKGDLEITKDSFKDSGGKEFWYPTADDEVTFELSLKGGKFIPTNVLGLSSTFLFSVTKYRHFPGGPKALERLIAAGKIAGTQQATEASSPKEKEEAVQKEDKPTEKKEEKKVSVVPVEERSGGKSGRRGSAKSAEGSRSTRKLSKDAPEFIPHGQQTLGNYNVDEGSALATPHGTPLDTDYWAEAARKVSSTSLHVSESDSLPITYAQLLHLQDFYEAIKHAQALRTLHMEMKVQAMAGMNSSSQ